MRTPIFQRNRRTISITISTIGLFKIPRPGGLSEVVPRGNVPEIFEEHFLLLPECSHYFLVKLSTQR